MPLVSIIMNVRNGAAFLREALDSVMAQTFADWELIVWDDCSTDDSANIVSQYHDDRIRYFLSPDETPLGTARDRAIRQARGEWLAFLDQDDVWLPHKLEQQMALIDDGVGIIYGRTVFFDSRRGNVRDYDYFHEFEALPEGDIFAELFRHACFIAMSSAVLRRSAVATSAVFPIRFRSFPTTTFMSPSLAVTTPAPCRTWFVVIACTPAACRLRGAIGCGCMKSRCRSSSSGLIVSIRD